MFARAALVLEPPRHDAARTRHARDHQPPHFHVITRKNERIAVVVETLIILAGEADPRDTAEAFAWARENRKELRSRWQSYSEEES